MYIEDMELGVTCFTCYCFMECKILEVLSISSLEHTSPNDFTTAEINEGILTAFLIETSIFPLFSPTINP